jgi:hypothetical protein
MKVYFQSVRGSIKHLRGSMIYTLAARWLMAAESHRHRGEVFARVARCNGA